MPVDVMDLPRNPARLHGEMWGITTYFNPAGYLNKRRHLEIFSAHVRDQGLKLMIVELAPPGASHSVTGEVADRIVRVQSDSVMWQKERMLNIGLGRLPDACDKVAWLDCDVLFEDPDWTGRTAELLEEYVVVQPYQTACWLPEGIEQIHPDARGLCTHTKRSTAYDQTLNPGNSLLEGHMGFGWVARRSALAAAGFYDRFITGGGDLVMTAAMYGYTETAEAAQWLREFCTPAQVADVLGWVRTSHAAVKRSVSYTPGSIFHLWHGSQADRQYNDRYRALQDANFDPTADLTLNSHQCWVWNSAKPELHSRVARYFQERNEDGQASR